MSLITTKEAADICGITAKTMNDRRQSPALRPVHPVVEGGPWKSALWDRAEVKRWARRYARFYGVRGLAGRFGNKAEGARNGNAVLPQEVVAEVRRLRAEGLGYGSIGKRLCLPKSTVQMICNGQRRRYA